MNVFLVGLTRGCVYALIALGYTLVYGILQLNFAHGDVFALSGLVASSVLLSLADLTEESSNGAVATGVLGALLIGMAFASFMNVSIEFIGYRRLHPARRA